jgi:hypothetical protein
MEAADQKQKRHRYKKVEKEEPKDKLIKVEMEIVEAE